MAISYKALPTEDLEQQSKARMEAAFRDKRQRESAVLQSLSIQRRNFVLSQPLRNPALCLPFRRAIIRLRGVRLWTKMLGDIQLYGTGACLLDQFGCYKECLPLVMTMKRRATPGEGELVGVKVPLGLLFHPRGSFLDYWSMLVLSLLLYSFLVIPYQLAFLGAEQTWLDVSLAVDVCFWCDIIVTLNTAVVQHNGKLLNSRLGICRRYLQGLFIVDVLSCLPFYKMQSDTDNSNNLLRYMHLLRLTRLARRSKLGKAVRSFLNLTHKCAEKLKMYSGLSRLITALCTVLILVHLGACMWFYSARLGGFTPETWVVRRDLQDESTDFLYLTSFYWAITTLTTVGYGDISARTELEMCIAMCWMMFGVGFYSFVVGSFTSALTSLDSKSLLIKERLQVVGLFAKDTGLQEELVKKLEKEVKDSVQTVTLDEVQRKSLLAQLSKSLRLKVARQMFDRAAEKIVFFTEIDTACLSYIVPLLTLKVVQAGKFLYEKGDYADEVYFVLKGRLLCVYGRRNTAFKAIVEGAYCGEIEVISNSPRTFSLMTEQDCELLLMPKDLFQSMMAAFPIVAAKVHTTASERQVKNQECLKEVLDVLEAVEIRHLATLDDLAGQSRLNMKEVEKRPMAKAVEAVLTAKTEEEVAMELKRQMAVLGFELNKVQMASQSFHQSLLSPAS